ncbi:LAMI_0C09186g1_1 [Lachancea mirantina]|uniref:LAMI_0C09186g1_1 n=1 Tax=Lachancea mirantina TaxID=1230905 RepID=A0A1G4J4Z3_9SACH|nr:LAMI_0C09186g1_1 [Lachancea mirantina]
MEALDVHSKSFVVRWLRVKQNDTVFYQLKPLKRSVGIGIYKRQTTINDDTINKSTRGSERQTNENGAMEGTSKTGGSIHIAPDTRTLIDYALNRSSSSVDTDQNNRRRSKSIAAVQHISQDIPLDTKLADQGFTLVKRLGVVPGNELVEGSLQAREDGYYAFIIDNTASKTVKKKILLSVAVKGQEVPHQLHRSSSQLTRVKQGRILQGYVLKKRRKRLQGFTKRFFKLDFKYKTLSYYLNEHNNVCRGEVVIPLATVSANRMTRLIIIDSGVEIWVLKAKDEAAWQEWIAALEECYSKEHNYYTRQPKDSKVVPETLPVSKGLDAICKKLEDCKTMSLAYFPPTTELRSRSALNNSGSHSPLSRTSSFSSLSNIFAKNKNGSQEILTKTAPDSPQLANLELSSPPQEHELYKNLKELEDLFHIWISKGKTVVKDRGSKAPSILSENEYYDAEDDNIEKDAQEGVIMLNDEEGVHALLLSESSHPNKNEEAFDDESSKFEIEAVQTTPGLETGGDLYPLPWNHKEKRRNDIPPASVPPPSLFSFLRKNVGKDLSSISMPITSNEPVSILQMLTETFEYSELLTAAASASTDSERLALVAAFSCSYLSVHRHKVRAMRKPFNPLLGETFELVREDKGIRLVAEKVSHKPQIFAFHVEHALWQLSYTVSPVQKFWGKSIEFINEGKLKYSVKSSGEGFVWSQPTTILKNILAGERYIEPTNHIEVVSSLGLKAKVAFIAGGMFGGRSEEVCITLLNGSKVLNTLKGHWTKSLNDTATGQKIWEVGELVPDPAKKYGFTVFTANLNDITGIEKDRLPPTDSRLRPDLRLYENGEVDKAEQLKLELEQAQRTRRLNSQDVEPLYFRQSGDGWKIIEGDNNYWAKRKKEDWSQVRPLW